MNSEDKTGLEERILSIIRNKEPQTLKELGISLQQEYHLTDNEIIKKIIQMQNEEKIELTEQKQEVVSFKAFLRVAQTSWYWITVVAMAFSLVLIVVTPVIGFPLTYLRIALVLFCVLILPGYSLLRILFPIDSTRPSTSGQLKTIQRIALSLGISIILTSLTGLIMYYSPLGLDSSVIFLAMAVLTLTFATSAVIKEYRDKRF